jgi:hypothetical protein
MATESLTIDVHPKKNTHLAYFRQEHLLFYVTAILFSAITFGLYLFATHSGGSWAWSGLPLDDNWIHLVYARSLAQRGWFFYNPGIPEAGMSSPLWVILLAIVYKVLTPLGISPQWVAKGLSLFFAFAVPLATYHLALEYKLSKRWAWFAGLVVIVIPNLAYGNVAGMEVPLFTLLVLISLWLILRQRYLFAGIVLGLGVLTRAEGVLNALIIGGAVLLPIFLKRKEASVVTSEELKLGLKIFLPSLVLGLAWSLYNYSINGHMVPNTYFVKHNFALGYFNFENIKNLLGGYISHLAAFNGLALPITLILLAAGTWSLYKSRRIISALPLLLIPIVQLYAFSINIKVIAGEIPWTYFTRRYMDFVLPLWIILISIGTAYLWSFVSKRKNRWVALGTPIIVFGVVFVMGWNFIKLNSYLIEQYSWNTENVEQVNVAMGKWIGENLPANATIGVTDAGAMRYWSGPDQRIIDFLGLNCAACIGRPLEELVADYNPDYIVVFRPALTGNFAYKELHSIQAQHNTILGGNELVAVKLNP